ncbi:MAG TPA: hypothetical protein VFK69_07845 [Candidatus Eisenbacteria bacterium]|nr:hypothetical protein [Candidatus Eisenbacteria bacterium]
MNHSRLATLLLLATAALSGMTLAGCSKKKNPIAVADIPPSVRLTNAPVDTTQAYFYSYKLNWIGFDPDGRVDHYDYAIDPTDRDTAWVRTTKNEQTIFFRATRPESLNTPIPEGQDFHVFVLRAVDNQGVHSAVVSRAFFSYTVAPTVAILRPRPSSLLEARVTPTVTISWEGHDPDGVFTQKPVKYKFRLFKYGEDPRIDTWITHPDSLRIAYAPTFAGWDSSTADTTFRKYTNLTPDSRYLFVVIAIDEAGAYSPIFSLDTNMLRLQVGFAGQLGPVITMFNSFFSFTYPSGGFTLDPSRVVPLDVPAADPLHDLPLTINWIAFPPDENGGDVEAYRWTMDIDDVDDETARSSERTDLVHWSQWDGTSISAQLGTFDAQGKIHGFKGIPPAGQDFESHNFYIEARDVNGFVSLGIIHFRVIPAKFDSLGHDGLGKVLIVNDTRLNTDQTLRGHPDSLQVPTGAWPDAAELDTFLFARGGVRWRMTPNGTVSRPGLFSGFNFDTLGTRNGKENPTVPLSLLSHYRFLIWFVDGTASQYAPDEIGEGPTGVRFPETTLRYMSSPNKQNTLASWVSQGGYLWLCGGGDGYASMAEWNNRTNDQGVKVFRSDGTKPDLVPGRFMYDVSHWTSEFRDVQIPTQIARVDQGDDVLFNGNSYPGIPLRSTHPEYQELPAQFLFKTPDTDPIYPYRTFSDFYSNNVYVEYLAQPNIIQQTVSVLGPNGAPHDSTYNVMDTLYVAWNPTFPYFNNWAADQSYQTNPILTVYRGADFPNPVIFQGFDIWKYQFPQLQSLVDVVLDQMWHVSHYSPQMVPRATVAPALAQPAGTRIVRAPARAPARSPAARPWTDLFRRR